jgi:hypothetical protein
MAGVVIRDADSVRSLGRSWAAMAHAVTAERSRLGRAAVAADVSNLAGTAGDRARAYVADLQAATTKMAAAYSAVASRTPRVAKSVEVANTAELARGRAGERVAAASAALTSAQTAASAASGAVTTQQAAASVASLVGIHVGPTPAQVAALRHAERLLTQARLELLDAQRSLRGAEQHFDEAERARDREASAFASLCRDQAAKARRTLSGAPVPTGLAPTIGATVDALEALSSVAAGLGLAVARFARGRPNAARNALESATSGAQRLERYGKLASVAGPAADAVLRAFADPLRTGADQLTQHPGIRRSTGQAR